MNQFTLFFLIHTLLGVSGDPSNGSPPQTTHDLSIPSSSKTITDIITFNTSNSFVFHEMSFFFYPKYASCIL